SFRAEKTDGTTGPFHASDSVVFKYRLVNRSLASTIVVFDTVQAPLLYSVVNDAGDTIVSRDTFSVHRLVPGGLPPLATIGVFEKRTKISKLRIVSGGGVIIVWPGIFGPAPTDTVHLDIDVSVDTSHTSRSRSSLPGRFDVFPVPVRTKAAIVSSAPLLAVVVEDLAGRVLLHRRLSGERTTEVDASGLPSGLCLMRCVYADGTAAVRKIVVE
ncbi:MAG: hypothetical protein RMM53_11810, partial [Bacteroidia bacterium]|nr:hypothetical protein [Bacteroidia bacterium]